MDVSQFRHFLVSYSSIPWIRVCPNLNAAVANELRIVGLTLASYLLL